MKSLRELNFVEFRDLWESAADEVLQIQSQIGELDAQITQRTKPLQAQKQRLQTMLAQKQKQADLDRQKDQQKEKDSAEEQNSQKTSAARVQSPDAGGTQAPGIM